MLGVELGDPLGVDELTATWPLSMPGAERQREQAVDLLRRQKRARPRARDIDLEVVPAGRAGDPPAAARPSGSPRARRRPGRSAARAVAHDVLTAEAHEVDALDVLEMSLMTTSPEPSFLGRSICVTSPVTTIFELNPSRVRIIFICSGVVFCASSRMIKESLAFGPA